jgi:hypothetical protein
MFDGKTEQKARSEVLNMASEYCDIHHKIYSIG